MGKLRTQLLVLFTVVSFISLIVSSAITVLLSADAVTQEMQKSEGEIIQLARRLKAEAQLDIDAISQALSSYGMYRLARCEEAPKFTLAQRRAIESGGWASKGWQANTRAYFLMDGELYMVSAQSRNIFALRNTLQGYLSVGCTVIILFTLLCVLGMRLAQPIVELSEATRKVAAGDFNARVQTRPRRKTAVFTQIDQLVNDFNQMADDLKNIAYLRHDFTSNISHEVKTPIAAISGYAQLLQAEKLPDDDRRDYARLIYEECARLTHLSENLLRITRMESRKQNPIYQTFALDEQLRRIGASLMPRAREAGLKCEFKLESARIQSDSELLAQVWTNLLDNAIKFTPPGGSIRVTLAHSEDSVRVCVSDTGIGIAESARAHVFEKFYQADTSRHTEGNGLGLALCKRIVDALGGQIELESAPGAGSRISVVLPKQPA